MKVALVSPSSSDMSVVAAVRVSPTWAVPLMVGAPVAAEFGGPGVTSSTPVDSVLPSLAHTAPWLAQSVVAGSDTVTSALPSG